jgi:excinuclease UvrABC ATPase subunit
VQVEQARPLLIADAQHVAEGSPESIAACPASHTGHYLKRKLGQT